MDNQLIRADCVFEEPQAPVTWIHRGPKRFLSRAKCSQASQTRLVALRGTVHLTRSNLAAVSDQDAGPAIHAS
jgi:hypothetical protein